MANLIGVAGEHFAAGELSRRGFLVTLTRGNAPGIDILAYHPTSQKTVAIQVKTALGSKQPRGQWIMNQKDEDEGTVHSQSFIFVYLPAQPEQPPEYTIVPSKTVAKKIFDDHRAWLRTPGAKGQQRSTSNTMRHFKDPNGDFRDKWDTILSLVDA